MITVRRAAASPQDGRAFALLADQAAGGLLRRMLGGRCTDIIARAFRSPWHDMSFEQVRFAEDDGSIVGMLAGYLQRDVRSSDGALLAAAGWRAPRLIAAWLIASPVLRFVNRVPIDDWYLEVLAVDPAARGRGVGTVLLDLAEEAAREAGASRLVLDVAVSNDGARRLYERRG